MPAWRLAANITSEWLERDIRRILILDLLDTSLVRRRSSIGGIVLALQTLGGGLDGRAGGGVGGVGGRHCVVGWDVCGRRRSRCKYPRCSKKVIEVTKSL